MTKVYDKSLLDSRIIKPTRRDFIRYGGSAGLMLAAYRAFGQQVLPSMGSVQGGGGGGGGQVAPTISSYQQTTNFTSGATTKSVTASWSAGDVIVCIGGSAGAGANALTAPTATGLTFTTPVNHTPSSDCGCFLSYATAAASGTSVSISASNASSSEHWGFGVWVFTGSNGVGDVQSAVGGNTSRTKASTPTAGAHSAYVWGVFDWAAAALVAGSPTPDHTRQNVKDGTEYTSYLFDVADQASAGATSYGVAGSGTGPFSIVIAEVKGH